MAEHKNNEFADALEGRRRRPEEPAKTPATRKGGKKHIGGLFDEAVSRQLKMIAAEEGTSVLALVAEGINHVFETRGKPPLAGSEK